MRSKQDALEFHSVGKEDLLNKSPINRRRVINFLDLPVSFSVHCGDLYYSLSLSSVVSLTTRIGETK